MERKCIYIVLACLGLVMEARAQESGLLRFSDPVQTVDTLRFDSGERSLRYSFRNISSKPVTILEVHSGCGCFTGEVSSRSLAPGAEAVLTARFSPENLHGPQNRHLTVVSSDGTDTFLSSITVQGYVLRDFSEGTIRYAEDLGEGLRTDVTVNALTLDKFGDFVFSIPLFNDTDRTVRLEVKASSGRIRLFAPQTIGPYSREDLRGEYNALWKRLGSEVTETLRLFVDGEEVTPLQIKGTIH